MTINRAFRLRNVAGEVILIDTSGGEARLDRVFRLSPSAAWLWNNAFGNTFSEGNLVDWLCEEFQTPRGQAVEDVHRLVTDWIKYGIVQ